MYYINVSLLLFLLFCFFLGFLFGFPKVTMLSRFIELLGNTLATTHIFYLLFILDLSHISSSTKVQTLSLFSYFLFFPIRDVYIRGMVLHGIYKANLYLQAWKKVCTHPTIMRFREIAT